ncbi:MAG TPA: hypothetical protein ENK52_03210, partial [Saprospiraceae bacterium]|nr:hypothetical protein [Saprospiraceae bacterium]
MNSKIKIELGYVRQLVLRLLLVLLVFSLARICFYAFNQEAFPIDKRSSFLSIFLYGIRFDLSAVIYVNSLLFISYLLPFSFRENQGYKKMQKIIFLLTNAIALAFEITDIGFFKYAARRSIGSDFSMLESTASLAPKYLLEHWYLLLLFVGFILLLNYLYNKSTIDTRGKKNVFSQVVLFLFGIAVLIIGSRGGLQPRPIMPIAAAEFVEDIRLVPLISNTTLGFIFSSQQRFVKAKNYFTQKELDREFSLIKKPKPTTPFKKENIFIIVLESFGKESIGFYNKKAKTPFLDSLIKQSLSFKNSFANGLRSTQGIVSISAGIPALMEDPLMFSVYQSNRINGIATLLKKENYISAFFHGANPGSMEFNHYSK